MARGGSRYPQSSILHPRFRITATRPTVGKEAITKTEAPKEKIRIPKLEIQNNVRPSFPSCTWERKTAAVALPFSPRRERSQVQLGNEGRKTARIEDR